MAKFTAAQRARIQRQSRPKHLSPDEAGGELNIIPFLDIVVNVLMFLLATITTSFVATLPVPAPSRGGNRPLTNHREQLNITVKIVPGGFIVGAGGGFLLPGCTQTGMATVTVPVRPQRDADGYVHDFAGLTTCMLAIRRTWREEIGDDHGINLSPNGEVPYGAMVRTIDAVRETRPGACRLPIGGRRPDYSSPDCLFPEVTLGVLR